jgi:hypothetical protein
MAYPCRDCAFDGRAQAPQVFVPRWQHSGECYAAARISIDEQLAVAKDLHGERWAGAIHIDEVDRLANQSSQLRFQLKAFIACWGRSEQHSEIEVRVRCHSTARRRPEYPQRVSTKSLIELRYKATELGFFHDHATTIAQRRERPR